MPLVYTTSALHLDHHILLAKWASISPALISVLHLQGHQSAPSQQVWCLSVQWHLKWPRLDLFKSFRKSVSSIVGLSWFWSNPPQKRNQTKIRWAFFVAHKHDYFYCDPHLNLYIYFVVTIKKFITHGMKKLNVSPSTPTNLHPQRMPTVSCVFFQYTDMLCISFKETQMGPYCTH